MAIALSWKAGFAVVATLFAGWTVTHLAARNEAMQLAKEYGHVRKGAINAPEVRIMTAEGAEYLVPALAHVPDLYKVSIYSVPLTPDQLAEISKLRHVDTLTIGAELTDDDVALLSKMTWVEDLDLSYNPLTDKSLEYIGKMKDLKALRLAQTKIDGNGLGQLQDLPHLRKLHLSGTKIDDKALDELAKITSIEEISLTNTAVSAEGLMKLTSLHRLRLLAFPEEQVFGDSSHDNLTQFKEAKWKFIAEFNELKRQRYDAAVADGLDVPDQFVSPFPEKRLE
ncbi:leucine-rich repeat domain-containing protein [Aeoliella sp. SH292]|uniref:leucine-rich repeat domain-containing protein n=1 Tax=Aeoliella sp. SH292 TaxID=3454464 RepID=UPI003F9909E8